MGERSDGRVRKLPSLWVNNTQLYAHRDAAVVRSKLDRAVGVFTASDRQPAYMLTACEIGGRKGLYGTDLFNRSAYRNKMKRLGMRFSDDPFVTFDGTEVFASDDFDPFVPEFLTLPLRTSRPEGVIEVRGAFLVHQISFYRLADLPVEELRAIVSLAGRIDAYSATEPEDLKGALTGAGPAP